MYHSQFEHWAYCQRMRLNGWEADVAEITFYVLDMNLAAHRVGPARSQRLLSLQSMESTARGATGVSVTSRAVAGPRPAIGRALALYLAAANVRVRTKDRSNAISILVLVSIFNPYTYICVQRCACIICSRCIVCSHLFQKQKHWRG